MLAQSRSWYPYIRIVLVVTLLASALLSLQVGASSVGVSALFKQLCAYLGFDNSEMLSEAHLRILMYIRLPRVLLAIMVGGGLAVAGATMQAVFRNPLADPGLIGITAGASLGAVTWIVFSSLLVQYFGWQVSEYIGLFLLPISAFIGGIIVTVIVYKLSETNKQVDVLTLLLAGIACNAVVGALIGLCTFMADDAQLRTLTFWSMGSLGNVNWQLLSFPSFIIVSCTILLMRKAHVLNALLLGEREAVYLGWSIEKLKRQCIILTVMLVGAATAITGGIGFIGLVVPHLCRLVLGPDHRYLMPCAALLGAIMLLLSDSVARVVISPAELPIGIITAAIGGPFFMFLLVQQKRRWSRA